MSNQSLPAIRVNQIGYAAGLPVEAAALAEGPFRLTDAQGRVIRLLDGAKCYLDETPSADTNEIAIYWNSPAVFTAAYFNMITR